MNPEREDAALNRALNLYEAPVDLDRFVARAMEDAPVAGNVVQMRRPRLAAPAWALAACALMGVLIGVGAGSFAPTDEADHSVAAAFGTVDAGDNG